MTPVSEAVRALAGGRPVVLLDDVSRRGGVVVAAAEHSSTATVAFLVRVSSGIVCVAVPGTRLDELRIPPLTAVPDDPAAPEFAVSVDLRCGITTGISARDRAATVRALGDPATQPGDLVRPGHVLPLRGCPGGVLERPRPAEAALDLCAAAGVQPAAALADAVDDSGDLAGPARLAALAEEHSLPLVRISDVVTWRRRTHVPVRAGARAVLPTVHGRFCAVGYGAIGYGAVGYGGDGGEHLALVRGDVRGPEPVLVHVHDECVAGDVLGSLRCSCAARISASLAAIEEAGRGVLVYLRSRRALGLGLVHALRGCTARDAGTAAVAAHILRDLGVARALLLTDDTDDPGEADELVALGIAVAGRRPLFVEGAPAEAEVV